MLLSYVCLWTSHLCCGFGKDAQRALHLFSNPAAGTLTVITLILQRLLHREGGGEIERDLE